MSKLIAMAWVFILLVNGFILGKVYYNRTEVVTQVALSERELQLPYNYGFAKEDSSLRFSLRWSTSPQKNELIWSWRFNNYRDLDLSKAHFASFKFPACTEGYQRNNKQLGWVLLELNGPAYKLALSSAQQSLDELLAKADTPASKEQKDELDKARENLAEVSQKVTRLFIVDAAAERELVESALQKRAVADKVDSSRVLFILPAEINSSYARCNTSAKSTRGIIVNKLLVDSLHAPKAMAEGFPSRTTSDNKVPFSATLSYGRLYEPWLSDLKF